MKQISHNLHKQKKSNQGFSLIEVLISILVMTFGLLGISGLMLKGVDNATGTDLASRANQSANEIMDAMRANAANKSLYLTNMGLQASDITGTDPSDLDRKQWLTALARLPGGQGKIEIDTSVSPNITTVTIQFNNCIGTLTQAEFDSCKNVATKRVLVFKFSV